MKRPSWEANELYLCLLHACWPNTLFLVAGGVNNPIWIRIVYPPRGIPSHLPTPCALINHSHNFYLTQQCLSVLTGPDLTIFELNPKLWMFKEPQESIPPAYVSLAGRYVKVGCGTGPPGWESILGSFKRFTNSGSEFDVHRPPAHPWARTL
jgi:hypothetical protein